jgi:catechol 2,3-dioxygenase-like lactoylglutathione lyase family enzyme
MGLVRRLQHTSVGFEAGREAEVRAFYGAALGLAEKPRPLGLRENPVIWFDAGDDEHEVHLLATPGYTAPAGNHLCLEVGDLAAMREQLRGHGVAIIEAQEIDNRPRFMVRDPFGNGIELTQVLGPYTPVAE